MNKFIKGNIRKILFDSNTSLYKVGLIKLRDTNIEELEEYVGKTITFTGALSEINSELEYILYGNILEHPRYGTQFNASSYEVISPSDKDGIIMYLSSGMFRGVGEKTAKKIVDVLGEETIKLIKEDYRCIVNIKGMNIEKAMSLSNKLIEFDSDQEFILKLNSIGFSTEESLKIINKYKVRLFEILNNNIYELNDLVSFTKLDNIYLQNNNEKDEIRIKALIKYGIKTLCYTSGDTMVSNESLFLYLNKFFKESLSIDTYYLIKNKLIEEKEILEINNYLILKEFHDAEYYISSRVNYLNRIKTDYKLDEIADKINEYQKVYNINFNDEQKEAIKNSVKNNLYIISGGPGTGKTTIIKAVTKIFEFFNVKPEDIALLAPTGRSAKRLSESTNLPAYTIHKFLKWNKETLSFSVNEQNKANEKIIIIDEFSMVDIFLFSSLLKGTRNNIQLILIGDANQLPSIMPGNVLYDLLNIDSINKKYLNKIYRTKEDSYIIELANYVRNQKEDIPLSNKSDFSFIESNDINIKKYLIDISEKITDKGIDIDNFQILAPMYKGENGIDNINKIMQNILNTKMSYKTEILIVEKIYR